MTLPAPGAGYRWETHFLPIQASVKRQVTTRICRSSNRHNSPQSGRSTPLVRRCVLTIPAVCPMQLEFGTLN